MNNIILFSKACEASHTMTLANDYTKKKRYISHVGVSQYGIYPACGVRVRGRSPLPAGLGRGDWGRSSLLTKTPH